MADSSAGGMASVPWDELSVRMPAPSTPEPCLLQLVTPNPPGRLKRREKTTVAGQQRGTGGWQSAGRGVKIGGFRPLYTSPRMAYFPLSVPDHYLAH